VSAAVYSLPQSSPRHGASWDLGILKSNAIAKHEQIAFKVQTILYKAALWNCLAQAMHPRRVASLVNCHFCFELRLQSLKIFQTRALKTFEASPGFRPLQPLEVDVFLFLNALK